MAHLAKPTKEKTIVVIGAGILGLASAMRLQEEFASTASVLIVAEEFPHSGDHSSSVNYPSSWAGAHRRFVPILSDHDALISRLAGHSYKIYKQIAMKHPEAGIKFIDAYEYFEKPSEAYAQLKGGYGQQENFRILDKSELPEGIKYGTAYTTWSLNPPVYCSFLLRRFLRRGGKVLRKRLIRPEEAYFLADNVPVVVNCSGSGFGDPAFYPIRGQTCLVANQCDKTITQHNADGTVFFLIPRPLEGGTIVGGTKEPRNWLDTPVMETRNRLLQGAAKMYPDILDKDGKFQVIRDIVGRRPAREGGLRLEAEELSSAPHKAIIHAYGAAGSGYEISWGVGEEVLKLIRERGPSEESAKL